MTSKTALIVDDSRLAQFVLKKMLVAKEMQVDTSESAEAALDYLAEQTPDMIFLDHTMPGMNGLEALKTIKNNPDTASIPVMMYTSQEDAGYMDEARELGAVDVLPKQLSTDDLEQALSRIGVEATSEELETAAANEAAMSPEEETEELKQLVFDAEAALERETRDQRLRQQVDKQQQHFDDEIRQLHNKVNALLPAAQNASNRQLFWNNILWVAIYCVTLVVFGTIYWQQQNEIRLLANAIPTSNTENTDSVLASSPETLSAPIVTEAQPDPAQPTANQTATTAPAASRNIQQAQDIQALQSLLNTNNQIPFDELLLGDTVLASLAELVPTLKQLDFSGEVEVAAHDGNFCVDIDSNGQFQLADEEVPVSQCELTEPSERLADIASINLLQFITDVNQSDENDFVIAINPKSTSEPLQNYPARSDDLSADDWNSIALRNRRIEITLSPEN